MFLDPSYFDEEIIDFLVENSYLTNNLPEASYTLYKRILQSGVEVEDFILRVKNLTSEEADEVIADTQISHDDKRIIARQKFPHDLDFAEEISPRKREDMSDEEFELWIYRSKEFTWGDDTFSILT